MQSFVQRALRVLALVCCYSQPQIIHRMCGNCPQQIHTVPTYMDGARVRVEAIEREYPGGFPLSCGWFFDGGLPCNSEEVRPRSKFLHRPFLPGGFRYLNMFQTCSTKFYSGWWSKWLQFFSLRCSETTPVSWNLRTVVFFDLKECVLISDCLILCHESAKSIEIHSNPWIVRFVNQINWTRTQAISYMFHDFAGPRSIVLWTKDDFHFNVQWPLGPGLERWHSMFESISVQLCVSNGRTWRFLRMEDPQVTMVVLKLIDGLMTWMI